MEPDKHQIIVAKFSKKEAAQAVVCQSGRLLCQRMFAPGTPLYFVGDQDAAMESGAGKMVCEKCYDYYENKDSTVTR